MRATRPPRGFTLIELLVVMAVLGLLASMLLPMSEVALQRSREHELRRNLWEIRDGLDAYKRAVDSGKIATTAGASGFPPSLRALSEGVPDARDGSKRYFLRRIPRDPFAPAELAAERTWGLRSFDSSAEQPRAGSDVYDVYSLSLRTALDGTPLRGW